MNNDPTADYQPLYLAYCQAHGKTPEEMRQLDRERFPGGHLAGYILWVLRQPSTTNQTAA